MGSQNVPFGPTKKRSDLLLKISPSIVIFSLISADFRKKERPESTKLDAKSTFGLLWWPIGQAMRSGNLSRTNQQ